MYSVSYKMGKIRLNWRIVDTHASHLADTVAATFANHTRLAIVSFGAIATGRTLHGVRTRHGLSPFATVYGIAASRVFGRQVVAPHALKFIMSGRRAGAKMPVRMIGTGVRGGKIFEPLPALITWFNALNISRDAWFPILRAISRRGIPPKDVPGRAIREGWGSVMRQARLSAYRIANGLVVK